MQVLLHNLGGLTVTEQTPVIGGTEKQTRVTLNTTDHCVAGHTKTII